MSAWDAVRVAWLIIGTGLFGALLGGIISTIADWVDAARSTDDVHTSPRDGRGPRGR